MTDQATPNLPARDFGVTSEFYTTLGFAEGWRDGGWMILTRGGLTLEFFPFPDLDPLTSSFGCCLRLDDLDAFLCVGAGGRGARATSRPAAAATPDRGRERVAHRLSGRS